MTKPYDGLVASNDEALCRQGMIRAYHVHENQGMVVGRNDAGGVESAEEARFHDDYFR